MKAPCRVSRCIETAPNVARAVPYRDSFVNWKHDFSNVFRFKRCTGLSETFLNMIGRTCGTGRGLTRNPDHRRWIPPVRSRRRRKRVFTLAVVQVVCRNIWRFRDNWGKRFGNRWEGLSDRRNWSVRIHYFGIRCRHDVRGKWRLVDGVYSGRRTADQGGRFVHPVADLGVMSATDLL